MKKFFILFIIIVSSFTIESNAQTKFYFDADYSLFRQDNSKALLEIYFAFYHKGFKYNFENGKYNASALLNVKIDYLETNSEVINKDFALPISLLDTNATQFKLKELSQVNFILENEGKYLLTLTGGDAVVNDNRDTLKFEINVGSYDLTKPRLSSIQLASLISKAKNGKSSFEKYGLDVTPNPNSFYGNNMKDLYYYVELYGLKNDKDSMLMLHKVLLNNTGQEINRSDEMLGSEYNQIYITGKINVDSLETGSYAIKMFITDESDNVIDSTLKKFYVYNFVKQDIVELPSDDKLYLISEYPNMKESQVEDEFNKAIYIRTDKEIESYKKLTTLDSKRRFLFDFWHKRDMKPETMQNEFKIEYFKRVAESNQKFRQGFTEGWKTDRGRFYITYGPPNDIDKSDMMSDINGYEIWHYDNVEGGKIAVFAEQQYNGSGIFELVHSTIRNEYRDDDWLSKLKSKSGHQN